jgi:uncharacterized membrane protein (DUF2068 family)
MRTLPPSAVGLRLIVLYKLGKAGLELAGSAALLALLWAGLAEQLHAHLLALRDHLVSAWAVHLADVLTRALTADHLVWLDLALLLDALVSGLEGWALHRRFGWARWLVVLATGSLLPFEVVSLLHGVHLGRALTLAINLAVVAYLVRGAAVSRGHLEAS